MWFTPNYLHDVYMRPLHSTCMRPTTKAMFKIFIHFQVKQITGTTADIFLEYTQRNLPEGVTMSVYQVGPQLTSIGICTRS